MNHGEWMTHLVWIYNFFPLHLETVTGGNQEAYSVDVPPSF